MNFKKNFKYHRRLAALLVCMLTAALRPPASQAATRQLGVVDGGTAYQCICNGLPCPCTASDNFSGPSSDWEPAPSEARGPARRTDQPPYRTPEEEASSASEAAQRQQYAAWRHREQQRQEVFAEARVGPYLAETHALWQQLPQQQQHAIWDTASEFFQGAVKIFTFRLQELASVTRRIAEPVNEAGMQTVATLAVDGVNDLLEHAVAANTAAIAALAPAADDAAVLGLDAQQLATLPQTKREALHHTAHYAKYARQMVQNGAAADVAACSAYLDTADYARVAAATSYSAGDMQAGDMLLTGAEDLLDDMVHFNSVKDSITRGSTFLAGILHGFIGLPGDAIEGYEDSFAGGQLLGAMLGIGADITTVLHAATLAVGGDAFAIGTVGVLAPLAVSLNVVATAEVAAASAAAAGHWERLKQAQNVLNEADEGWSWSSWKNRHLQHQPHHPDTPPDKGIAPIHWGQQSKHLKGDNNWKLNEEKSFLTHPDPQALLNRCEGTGARTLGVRGSPGFKERINFGEVIGNVVGKRVRRDGSTFFLDLGSTTWGWVHHNKYGAHIVPASP